ncbi:MAG: CAAX prenyl protease-related protein [Verrucomicrobiota bacterium]|nr:CAAX prenyl protease-related protein [Verrucomicrobiota bacterium]
MNVLKKPFAESSLLARVAPFFIFLALTFCQGQFGEASRYWFYLLKTLAGIWLIWMMRPFVAEMKWAFSWEAVVVGVLIFIIWVGIDKWYPSLDQIFQRFGWSHVKAEKLWNPHDQFGQNSLLAWLFIFVRIFGSALVVPPLEEVFYRSFLYRYITRPDFETVPLGQFLWKPFLLTAAIFGFVHAEWLAGILCGLAFQWLVVKKQRLGDAMTAHAITNFLLGLWVVWKGDWKFW